MTRIPILALGLLACAITQIAVAEQRSDAEARHRIVGSGQETTHECGAGEIVDVTGAGNRITLRGPCGLLEIDGTDNVVHAETLAKADVTGSGNQVFWRSGKAPAFQQTGVDNRLVREGE